MDSRECYVNGVQTSLHGNRQIVSAFVLRVTHIYQLLCVWCEPAQACSQSIGDITAGLSIEMLPVRFQCIQHLVRKDARQSIAIPQRHERLQASGMTYPGREVIDVCDFTTFVDRRDGNFLKNILSQVLIRHHRSNCPQQLSAVREQQLNHDILLKGHVSYL